MIDNVVCVVQRNVHHERKTVQRIGYSQVSNQIRGRISKAFQRIFYESDQQHHIRKNSDTTQDIN